MANFFSKYFSEIALMATAVLWAGCGNVDKDSKNEKSVSSASNSFGVSEISNSVESSDSAALQNVTEKDDSLVSEILKDSLDANAQTVVLLDSAKQLEKLRTIDSLMKAYFPIEWNDVEKKKDVYQYALMIFAKNRDSILKARSDLGSVMCHYGVIVDRYKPRPHLGFKDDFKVGFNDGTGNSSVDGRSILQSLLGISDVFPSKWSVKVLYENIEFADKRTPNQDMLSRIKRVIRQRTPGLRHLYGKFLKKNPDNSFEGEITLKLTIAADGTVKKSSIKKSTTGVKEFDENIRIAVSRWTFPKVKSGTIVVYVPIRFYE
ncbi:AgmX/PglI C-terminal domain-containing protein [Fibrobacter sp. UWB12]|uniref:AgmX/PglI C-terminal domain-containing protein n=1 Tax=Fibrobacter sp. UWB12 TaxID=1896203 RepID=UPI001587D90A|nr:AgmX/PglI C-terminal domain-containing protein [Fibrobacter sp. UWB12]